MSVTVTRKQSFVEFLVQKLESSYTRIPNSRFSDFAASLKNDPYFIRVNEVEGQAVIFYPQREGFSAFGAYEHSNEPDKGRLSLKAYQKVPDDIQEIVNEYAALNPNYNLEIQLAPLVPV